MAPLWLSARFFTFRVGTYAEYGLDIMLNIMLDIMLDLLLTLMVKVLRSPHDTMVQNNQKSGLQYWATGSFVCLLHGSAVLTSLTASLVEK